MKILALEFSTTCKSVALAIDGVVQAEVSDDQFTHPLLLIEETLKQAGASKADIEAMALGIGPGSYTGIRLSIAIAQGLYAAAAAPKVIPVNSLLAVAHQAREKGMRGKVHVIADAQRGELYKISYMLSEADVTEMEALHLGKPQDFRGDEAVIGPQAERFIKGGQNINPRAGMVAQLAERNPQAQTPETIEPTYLRQTAFVKVSPAKT